MSDTSLGWRETERVQLLTQIEQFLLANLGPGTQRSDQIRGRSIATDPRYRLA